MQRSCFGLWRILFLLALSLPLVGKAQQSFSVREQEDPLLQQKIQALVKDFKGEVGIYVHHLASGKTAAHQADTLFPTASMIKIPITIGLFHQIEQGALQYHQPLLYRDSLLYPGVDLLGAFRDSAVLDLSKLPLLMLSTSDNTASLWAQQLAGTGTAINQWLADQGYRHTRVNSRTEGRRSNWVRYGWGQTTPREMAALMLQIRRGEVLSAAASERLYRTLTNSYWDSYALGEIPPTVQAASKQGAVDDSRSEVVLVNAPSGDYVFCIITKNQKDQSWESTNEGWELIRRLSKLLWKHFEPESSWEPARGIEKWQH